MLLHLDTDQRRTQDIVHSGCGSQGGGAVDEWIIHLFIFAITPQV